jgi:general secretion pathway protein H
MPHAARPQQPGSPPRLPARRAARGFTLIELIVVVAIIAIGVAVTTLALRDPTASQLEREAARLSALLESARAEARALGLPVRWQPAAEQGGSEQFHFVGLPPSVEMPQRFLAPGVQAQVVGAAALLLGPEAIIPAQRVVLSLGQQQIVLATDGLGPFTVAEEAPRS